VELLGGGDEAEGAWLVVTPVLEGGRAVPSRL